MSEDFKTWKEAIEFCSLICDLCHLGNKALDSTRAEDADACLRSIFLLHIALPKKGRKRNMKTISYEDIFGCILLSS